MRTDNNDNPLGFESGLCKTIVVFHRMSLTQPIKIKNDMIIW